MEGSNERNEAGKAGESETRGADGETEILAEGARLNAGCSATGTERSTSSSVR